MLHRSTVATGVALAFALSLSACAPGRYTGGGNLIDGGQAGVKGAKPPPPMGTFTLNNISAADCSGDGGADTYRGEARWRAASGESFTCYVSPSVFNTYTYTGNSGTWVDGTATYGSFAGTITQASGNLNGAAVNDACYVNLYQPAPKTPWQVTLTANASYIYERGGTVSNGNATFHSENTTGVCSSAGSGGKGAPR